MANEISSTTRLSWSKNGVQIIGSVTSTSDQTGDQAMSNVQIIGTSSEAIEMGDVVTIGHLMFKNLDATNTIHIGTTNPVTSENAEISLKAGRGTTFPTTIASWYAIAETGNSNLQVIAIES